MVLQSGTKRILKLTPDGLEQILDVLHKIGFETIGPTLGNDAIVYETIGSIDDLPQGWTDKQEPAAYRIIKRNDQAYFGFNAAPQSWKRFLYPPYRTLFRIRRKGKGLEFMEQEENTAELALIGVRPCELEAITIQERVFTSSEQRDDSYLAVRKKLFIIAVNCTSSGGNCFCASMNTGPHAKENFDLALTEVVNANEHFFIVEIGSETGLSVIHDVESAEPTEDEVETAAGLVRQAESQIRKLDLDTTPKLLSANLEHPEWDEVSKRCLACGNCTMVCPTCFCSTVEDTTDLSGKLAERRRRWDSCFTLDFAKVAGGNFRTSPRSRYRQWLTHKLSSWVDQFGKSGCVGCGRCITWCPVGIDITAEVQKITGT